MSNRGKRHNLEYRKEKFDKRTFYNGRSLLGNYWARIFALIGGRQTGKSYWVMDFFLYHFFKSGKKDNFIWLRLSDTSAKKLLKNNAFDLVDPDLKRKYKLDLVTKGDNVFYRERIKDDKGKIKVVDTLLCRVLSLSGMHNDKGIGFYDKDREGNYHICLDEMNRERNERNTFDISYNFVNQIENLLRDAHNDEKHKVRVFLIGNTLQEASDLMTCFNFLPEKFGRYKIRKKELVVEYLPNSKAYKKMRKNALANVMLGEDESTFTNKVEFDLKLVCKNKLIKPYSIIKFSNNKKEWFTVWNDNIIDFYNNEQKESHYAMTKYLIDERYDPEKVKKVIKYYDLRYFKFHTLMCQRQFKRLLELLKVK